MKTDLSKLDLGAIMQAAVDQAAAAPTMRDLHKDQTGFCTVSLGAWLDLCSKADVPCVPATRVGSAPIERLLRFDVEPHHPDLKALHEAIQAAKVPGFMLRWDCCSPLDTKGRLAEGKADWDPVLLNGLYIDDPRAYDIIAEFPGDDMWVWQRPWLASTRLGGYPVEYRAFVHDGQTVGIANYYPQRPLPDDDATRADVRTALALTARLTAALDGPMAYPCDKAERWGDVEKSFTADFFKDDQGNLLFLEGGPPYGAGAHPCCFPANPKDWESAATYFEGGVPAALAAAPQAPRA